VRAPGRVRPGERAPARPPRSGGIRPAPSRGTANGNGVGLAARHVHRAGRPVVPGSAAVGVGPLRLTGTSGPVSWGCRRVPQVGSRAAVRVRSIVVSRCSRPFGRQPAQRVRLGQQACCPADRRSWSRRPGRRARRVLRAGQDVIWARLRAARASGSRRTRRRRGWPRGRPRPSSRRPRAGTRRRPAGGTRLIEDGQAEPLGTHGDQVEAAVVVFLGLPQRRRCSRPRTATRHLRSRSPVPCGWL